MPRIPVFADGHPRVLDRVVREKELCAHDSSLRVRVGVIDESPQPSGHRDRVVVQEDQVVAGRSGRTVVAGGRKSRRPWMGDDANIVAKVEK